MDKELWIGEFDHYSFGPSNDQIWFKNLRTLRENEDHNKIVPIILEKAFMKKEDAIFLIGNLIYEDKVEFKGNIILNQNHEYEIRNPIDIRTLNNENISKWN